MVLTILNVVGEETKLLLPGSKIIIGRMHMQHPKFTNFGKSVFSVLYKDSNLYFSPERELTTSWPKDWPKSISCSSLIIISFSSASYADPEWQLFLPYLLSCFRQQMGLVKHSSHQHFLFSFYLKKVPWMIVIRYWHWINVCESEWRSPAIFDAFQQKRGYVRNLQHSHH